MIFILCTGTSALIINIFLTFREQRNIVQLCTTNPLADVRRGPCLLFAALSPLFLICTLMCTLRANAEILLNWSLLQSVGIKDLTTVLKQIVGCAYICLQLNNIDRGYWSQGVF